MKVAKVLWVLFYGWLWLYTFLVVPSMGDWVYFVICILACFGGLASGFVVLPYQPERSRSIVGQTRARRGPRGHTEKEWRALVEKYNRRCLCCQQVGTRHNPITRDHVLPISKGGPDTIDNLQPLCKSCNSRKKDKTIDYR